MDNYRHLTLLWGGETLTLMGDMAGDWALNKIHEEVLVKLNHPEDCMTINTYLYI